MNFTLWLFRDWFVKKEISNSYKITNTFAPIVSVGFDNSSMDSGIACISSHTVQNHSGDFYRCKLTYKNDEILFPVTSQESVYNLCLDMITFYNDWENSIHDQIINGASVPELLHVFSQAFPHPMAVLYQNVDQNCYSSDWQLRLSKKTLDKIPGIVRPDTNKMPVFLPADFFGVDNAIIKQIPTDHHSAVYLAAYDTGHNFKTGELYLFHIISEFIAQSIQFQRKQHQHIHPLATWYQQQLDPDVQLPVNTQTLQNLGWKTTDSYQILSIQTDHLTADGLHQFQELLTGYNYCCISVPEGLSVLLHQESRHSDEQSDRNSFLLKLCARRNTYAGFSLSFQGLNSLLPYYQQSVQSAALAKEKQQPYIFTQDHLADFIHNACSTIHDVRACIHPDVSTLIKLDAEDRDELIRTLYTYLFSGKSCIRTAEKLEIHRNTLRTRLARINAIFSLDTLDEMELEHIMLSLLFISSN
ncbi:helix-turn-helix domain-containing protein [uncultured Eubacterium sp.]|uniref:PucR family transcriptional regulator n=1 Tax=uncultured Eubacterium sp. TaxID=165185 RepID=UPI0025D52EE6|nr:helix-turn-helix domain-containing protein [uncultured Eubacterium sp.]MCI6536657.1 helix-turn-helix domain-containing protein [Lachnospiraceae bacterium]